MTGGAGLLLAALCVIGASGCSRPAVVTVETAERRDIPLVVELAGRAEATATVEIRANVEGRLTGLYFQEGRLIRKGQLLFRIDRRRYDAAVQAAGAMVEKAEADLEMAREQQRLVNAQSALRQAEANLLKSDQDLARLRPLAARRAVPARDLDSAIAAQSSAAAAVQDAHATVRTTTIGDRMGIKQAQAGVTVAKAALESAMMDRAETEIRAPIGGLIGRAEVSVGNGVGRGGPSRLAAISQVDPIRIVFGISETLYLSTVNTVARSGLERMELILADGSLYPFPGRFTNLAGAVDDKTGTLPAVAQFANPKALVLPGMTGRVRLDLGIRPNAVLVSERALFETQGTRSVCVVTSESRVESRRVVTDGSWQGRVVVTSGLGGGETVIVSKCSQLQPGQVVTTQPDLRRAKQ